MDENYTREEQRLLLTLARQTLEATGQGTSLPGWDLAKLPAALRAKRACFVTLTVMETAALRGCTGTLTARYTLAKEVIVSTEQTARNDPRFPVVSAEEVAHLHIEISVLTPMVALKYQDSADLLQKLRPEIDGVTLQYRRHRATFLPQVWERVAEPAKFLTLLCNKMQLPGDLWQRVPMQVFTYQSIIIEEPRPH